MGKNIPRVGVGVIILREGRLLLGKRKGAHGAGTWALPGGHLEFGEAVETCAAREVWEETGLSIHSMIRGPYTNDIFPEEGRHYVTLFVVASSRPGTPRVYEPDKCECWQWFCWSNLPQPLFPPLASLEQSGFVPEHPL